MTKEEIKYDGVPLFKTDNPREFDYSNKSCPPLTIEDFEKAMKAMMGDN